MGVHRPTATIYRSTNKATQNNVPDQPRPTRTINFCKH